MTRIGLLSDTHGYWDERYAAHLADVDQIWHAGDIGSTEVAEKLAALHPLKAVYGNVDGGDLRMMFREILRFRCEEVDVSRPLRPQCRGNTDHAAAKVIHQWPFPHFESAV